MSRQLVRGGHFCQFHILHKIRGLNVTAVDILPDDTSQMEEQLEFMEQDLENFPSEDEQHKQLVELHIELTHQAIANHKVQHLFCVFDYTHVN